MQTLSERLKEARKEAGLTQVELTRKAHLKRQSIVGSLESGGAKTSVYIPQIAAALGVSALWLAEGRGQKRAEDDSLQEVRDSGIDALRLSQCLTAVDAFLVGAGRVASQDERIAFACDLYSVFKDNDASVETMRTFIERWHSVAQLRAKPGKGVRGDG